MTLYGKLPAVVCNIGGDIDCEEMMYYLYLPIKLPDSQLVLESRVEKFRSIIEMAMADNVKRLGRNYNKYIYLTVKTLPFCKGNTGQRPGWHSDGFMTDDVNYIWYTDVPTIFCAADVLTPIIQDHEKSLTEMEMMATNSRHVSYPNRTLLRLDQGVIHKVNDSSCFEGVRTFVKISISDKPYALKGNSINSALPLSVEYKCRIKSRNCPIGNSKALRCTSRHS